MADTINELYAKYTEGIEGALEEDRYFQYLFEMIQAGDNTLEQKNRVLHKVVDERWLTVVEEGIEAIFNIVDKPRRFITTSEEVVPVALAKKITADSVRHLSQHTQFIAQNEEGEIMPTKILNVSVEESYDLYENRFVYHLIQRLFSFVDKRTDVIFWSTGDETCNVMSMESKIDDAYEEISYKVEMTIKNRQSVVENDMANMDLFKRIDRVRRMSRTLRASSFCDIMNGCAKVHSPIQRTNLMMKDPDYRTCYQLWQFIESYDEVGYTIEEQDSTMQFDEEYLLQMYINMITNYTVFKSLLVSDPRKMSEIATEKREPVKPKFVKEIKEEIVEDRNIPDVEIRRVFVEEVTEAQLEAEEKLREETTRREELENSISELEWQMDSLNQQLEWLEQMKAQMEEEKSALETQVEEEKKAREDAEEATKQTMLDTRIEIEAAQKEAKEQVEAIQKEADDKVNAVHKATENQIAEAHKQAEDTISQIRRQAEAEIADVRTDAENTIEEMRKIAEDKVATAEQKAAEQVNTVKLESERKMQAAEQKAAEQVNTVKLESERKMQAAEQKASDEIRETKEEKEKLQTENTRVKAEIEKARKEAEDAKNAEIIARKELEEVKKASETQIKEAEKRVARAEKAKEKAVAKSEANSLSRYIVNALQERKERKKVDGDEK
nr:DUF2357 domain-containing protein [uncultured Dorea sp.]